MLLGPQPTSSLVCWVDQPPLLTAEAAAACVREWQESNGAFKTRSDCAFAGSAKMELAFATISLLELELELEMAAHPAELLLLQGKHRARAMAPHT